MRDENFRAIASHINSSTRNNLVSFRHRFLHASSNAILLIHASL